MKTTAVAMVLVLKFLFLGCAEPHPWAGVAAESCLPRLHGQVRGDWEKGVWESGVDAMELCECWICTTDFRCWREWGVMREGVGGGRRRIGDGIILSLMEAI